MRKMTMESMLQIAGLDASILKEAVGGRPANIEAIEAKGVSHQLSQGPIHVFFSINERMHRLDYFVHDDRTATSPTKLTRLGGYKKEDGDDIRWDIKRLTGIDIGDDASQSLEDYHGDVIAGERWGWDDEDEDEDN